MGREVGSAIWEKFPKNTFFSHSHLIILRHVLCLLHFVFNTSPSTFRPLRRIPIMKRRTVTWASLLVPQRSWRLVTFDTFEKATFMVCSTIIREIYISKIINFECCICPPEPTRCFFKLDQLVLFMLCQLGGVILETKITALCFFSLFVKIFKYWT